MTYANSISLIAIMVGRLQMNVNECIEAYTNMFERIFQRQKHRHGVNFLGSLQNKFDSDILRASIVEIVKSRGWNETEAFNAEGDDRPCRV